MQLPSRPLPNQTLDRASLLSLLHAALNVSENRYARLFALGWLGAYPGDLEVRLLYARAMVQEGLLQQALPVLEELAAADPEFLGAQELLASTLYLLGSPQANEAEGRTLALGGRRSNAASLPHWTEPLRAARKLLTPQDHAAPQPGIPVTDVTHEVLGAIQADFAAGALATVTNLRLALNDPAMDPATLLSLAETAFERWPECLPCKLIYADLLVQEGRQEQALALLHQAMSQDITGQVARRLWGDQHPYQPLWPAELVSEPGSPSAPQSIPVPAEVAGQFGWNQLPMPGTPRPTFPASMLKASPAMAHALPGSPSLVRRLFRHYTPPEEIRRSLS
mgnify:CR=1 FL=1